MTSILNERKLCDYNDEEKDIISSGKKAVLADMEYIFMENKDSLIHDNQILCSEIINAHLNNKKIINLMIVALTQSGKTGAMCSLIKTYLEDKKNIIPIVNIYFITGLSSKEWVLQTKSRLPIHFRERVYHRDLLKKDFVTDIKDKKNVLIICDEIQIASKKDKTLHDAFDLLGFYNKQTLLEKDIKIIEFSATPDGTFYDSVNWGENSFQIKMEPGDNYTSCFDFLNQKRVCQYKDLCCYDKKNKKTNTELASKNIQEVKKLVDEYRDPLYHIIRAPVGYPFDILIDNFKNVFRDVEFKKYVKESDIEDINLVLEKKPDKHTFIFIKEKLRCAKTIKKTYLGILYERYTKKPDDSVVTQGLIGRGTGYDDTEQTKFFTNIETIEKYKELWDSVFTYDKTDWKSKTTHFKGKTLHSKGTYLDPTLIVGMDTSDKEEHYNTSKEFDTQKEGIDYILEFLDPNKKGPRTRTKNKDGFYEATIWRKEKIWSIEEIIEKEVYKGQSNNGYWFYPAYKDIKDKTTLKWVVIKP